MTKNKCHKKRPQKGILLTDLDKVIYNHFDKYGDSISDGLAKKYNKPLEAVVESMAKLNEANLIILKGNVRRKKREEPPAII